MEGVSQHQYYFWSLVNIRFSFRQTATVKHAFYARIKQLKEMPQITLVTFQSCQRKYYDDKNIIISKPVQY